MDKSAQKRKRVLRSALKKAGLELRNDSPLSLGYIAGTERRYTVAEIVEKMQEAEYLHKHTSYEQLWNEQYWRVEDTMRELVADGVEWNLVYSKARNYWREMFRLQALKEASEGSG